MHAPALRRMPACCLLVVALAAPTVAQPFTFTMVETDLVALSYADLAYADLDRDGDFDLVASGNASRTSPFAPASYVALNAGERSPGGSRVGQAFIRTGLATGTMHGSVAWADYDRDGDLDFVKTGTPSTGAAFEQGPLQGMTRLYRNDGSGRFDEIDAGLVGVYGSAVAWGDYDNDGDPDLVLSGSTTDEMPVTRLYRNDGGGFSAVETSFRQVRFGDVQWGDYDNDGDLDLVLGGVEATGQFVTRLYRNDGTAGFTEVDAGFRNLAFSALDWGDYDADGDLDLVLSGGVLSLQHFFEGVTDLYRNDAGTFTRVDAGLDAVFYGHVAWGDYDADGDLDLLAMGGPKLLGGRVGLIYQNTDGVFMPRVALAGTFANGVGLGDYDGDLDLDVLATGTDVSFLPLVRLYRNDQLLLNDAPTAPTALNAVVQGRSVTLSWEAGADAQTPAPALTYNLRVGTSPGAANVLPPLATPETGHRWVPYRGNAEHNTRWTLAGLAPGTYFWSVQAVDAGFIGSPFAAEGTFTVSPNAEVGTGVAEAGDLPTRVALHPAYPNPFRESTTLAYDLPEPTRVVLTLFNVLGAEVGTLVDAVQPAGRRQVSWDGRDASGRRLGAGVYVARLQIGTTIRIQKLTVLH